MITSPQNAKVKLARALLTQSKARRKSKQFVLEGVRLLEDALSLGYAPQFVLHAPDADAATLAKLHAERVTCEPLAPEILAELSDTVQSQGFLAVYDQPHLSAPDKPISTPDKPTSSIRLALDGLRDPGNLGTLLRTAAAADVAEVLLLPGTVDPTNPKTVRAGMGAHFRLRLTALDWPRFEQLYTGGAYAVWMADARAADAVPYTNADWTQSPILILGNEAHGVSAKAQGLAAGAVYIPMARQIESLNSAMAGAIILYEMQRQRGGF